MRELEKSSSVNRYKAVEGFTNRVRGTRQLRQTGFPDDLACGPRGCVTEVNVSCGDVLLRVPCNRRRLHERGLLATVNLRKEWLCKESVGHARSAFIRAHHFFLNASTRKLRAPCKAGRLPGEPGAARFE